jgi:hypothetical protein
VLYHFEPHLQPFLLLGIIVILLGTGLDHNPPPTYVFCIPGVTGICHHAQFLLAEMASRELFAWADLKPILYILFPE